MSEIISQISEYTNSNPIIEIGFGIFIGFWVLLLLKNLILTRLNRFSRTTKNKADDLVIALVEGVKWPFYLCLSFIINIQLFGLPLAPNMMSAVYLITGITLAFYTISAFTHFIFYLAEKSSGRTFSRTQIAFFNTIIYGILWSIVIVIIAQNLGLDLSALITGLGIGGVAIAFALQNILGDLFASISIYLDKPFEIGDPIDLEGEVGTVDKIGLKTTRIKTLQGEELIVNNRDLTEARVRNYQRMDHRRIEFKIGVDFSTNHSLLTKYPEMLTKIIDSKNHATVNRIHLTNIGSSALEYEIVYTIDSSDFDLYRDIHQAILLEVLKISDSYKITIPYPTQKLYVSQNP